MNLHSLPTPFVAIDRARVKSNIAAMQEVARAAGVALRPHAKTHKSPAIANWQLEAGAVGICCAKLAEAEVFADAGITDIRVPYPVNPVNAGRVRTLLSAGVTLSIVVDDVEVARQWSQAMTGAGMKLSVLVKVDVGFHRCGIDPESPHAIDAIRTINDLAGLSLRGLLSHAGHSYGAGSGHELAEIADKEIEILRTVASGARSAGVEIHELSVGSTPTARFIPLQKGATEMRPGNYVFYDRTQLGLGATTASGCAMSVIATVVSRPVASRVIFDAGSKTLTSDAARGFGTTVGHGLVYPDLETETPQPSITIERLSEEHAVARVLPNCTLRPGDRVRILPNHACVVTNLADELVLVDGMTVVDRIAVGARGKNY
ncbi:MAG TPA: alanine racemase [Vicinamibacterales bacterium]|nr:alanine racemase [Vicinamibacterales bacterium]